MYKCGHTRYVCIHLRNICDGEKNCPFGDDENLCQLQNFDCPLNCECLALAILCQKKIDMSVQSFFPQISISMDNIYTLTLTQFHHIFPQALFISFIGNNMSEVCSSKSSPNILFADFAFNPIKYITRRCFTGYMQMKTLLLDNNRITYIESFTFSNLLHLKTLSLSQNPMRKFLIILWVT